MIYTNGNGGATARIVKGRGIASRRADKRAVGGHCLAGSADSTELRVMYSPANDINDIRALDRTDAARLADQIFDLVLIAALQRDKTLSPRRSRTEWALALADARSRATD